MSGGGKGVATAMTTSNAITNLYASVFCQHQSLEPLHPDKKIMWKREMDCLLSVCDCIVEFVSTSQMLQNGTSIALTSRPRSDIHINLLVLRKLDAMFLEILDSFEITKFWYAEKGSMSNNSTRAGSFRKIVQVQPQPQRKEEKWWLPVVCVPSSGISEKERKHLRHKHDCANQIHKAAMAINSNILTEVEIPKSYLASLPKSGKASVGDSMYRHMYSAETADDSSESRVIC